MALILCCILGIAGTSAAIPLNLLDPEQSLTPAVQPPSRISHSTNQSWEASNSTSAVSAPFTLCYKESQGSALIADQCVEALVNSDFARLPPTEVLTFAPRSSPALAGQFELPRRYQSSDGKCAIEPSLSLGELSARNTAQNINRAANYIIHKCVDHNHHRGGLSVNLGGDNNLDLRIFSFKPEVQCYGSVNRQSMVTSCNNLANEMKASPDLVLFANTQSIPYFVRLPYTEMDPAGGGCKLEISIDRLERQQWQYGTWNIIWQAVVAINAMCIRKGQRGRWLSMSYTLENPGIIDVDVGEG